MRVFLKRAVLVVVVLLVVACSAGVVGLLRWHRASDRLADQLAMSRLGPAGVFTAASVTELPAPVARYFRHVLREGQPLVPQAEFTQSGEFLIAPGQWAPFSATQQVIVRPPGFLWHARIRAMPFVSVYVRDSYVVGSGTMAASFAGLYLLVQQSGRSELDAGALQRYLGEAIWLPTALLPPSGVTWTALTDRSALASLTDDETTVTLEFHFNEAGEAIEIYAPARYREVEGRYEPTPWSVTCSEYVERAGMRIPSRCVAQWLLPAGPQAYWRGRIEDAHYVLR
jgi:hypothetical protein